MSGGQVPQKLLDDRKTLVNFLLKEKVKRDLRYDHDDYDKDDLKKEVLVLFVEDVKARVDQIFLDKGENLRELVE